MPEIYIYTKPNCWGCEYTLGFLDEYGIKHEEPIDVTLDEEAMADIQAHGFMGLPVVAIGSLDNAWSGVNIPRLEELI